MYTSKPFKILDSEYVFHGHSKDTSTVYSWNGSCVGNIASFVRGYANKHGRKGLPGQWYVYGSGYKKHVNTLPHFKSIDLNEALKKAYRENQT